MSQRLQKIMVKNVITARSNDSVSRVAELMNKHEIGCVIIVDNGTPVGVVTERDMIKRVVGRSNGSKKKKAAEIMSEPLIEASPEMPVGEAAKLMLKRNIKKLPIIENRQLVGLVTLTDLIRSEGITKFLNGVSLNGVSPRLKKAVNIYFDAEQLGGRARKLIKRCPLMMKDGLSVGCGVEKCMWWTGKECAVSRISQHLEAIQS
jgi:CBS domain-containing protein